MNKNELVEAVAGQVGDRRTATAAVEAVLGTVMRAVRDGEPVALSGFGVFEKVDRAARSARNPSTGATVAVAATSAPRFRPGQVFKDVVGGRRELPQLSAPVARTSPVAPEPVTAVEPVVEEVADPKPVRTSAGAKESGAKKAGSSKADTKEAGTKKAATRKSATRKSATKKAATKKAATKKSGSRTDKKGKAGRK